MLHQLSRVVLKRVEFHVWDMQDPAFAERVYRFFGQVPPWTDGAIDGERRM